MPTFFTVSFFIPSHLGNFPSLSLIERINGSDLILCSLLWIDRIHLGFIRQLQSDQRLIPLSPSFTLNFIRCPFRCRYSSVTSSPSPSLLPILLRSLLCQCPLSLIKRIVLGFLSVNGSRRQNFANLRYFVIGFFFCSFPFSLIFLLYHYTLSLIEYCFRIRSGNGNDSAPDPSSSIDRPNAFRIHSSVVIGSKTDASVSFFNIEPLSLSLSLPLFLP